MSTKRDAQVAKEIAEEEAYHRAVAEEERLEAAEAKRVSDEQAAMAALLAKEKAAEKRLAEERAAEYARQMQKDMDDGATEEHVVTTVSDEETTKVVEEHSLTDEKKTVSAEESPKTSVTNKVVRDAVLRCTLLIIVMLVIAYVEYDIRSFHERITLHINKSSPAPPPVPPPSPTWTVGSMVLGTTACATSWVGGPLAGLAGCYGAWHYLV